MSTQPQPKRRSMLSSAVTTVVLILLAIFVLLAMYIDDWRRDLTTNHAATSADAADETLRPIATALTVSAAADLVERAAATLPRWQAAGRNSAGDAIELRFVRTTPLMRFKDDITVRVVPATGQGGGGRITAESQSRVGKGDLGQNPRNLRELLTAIRGQMAGG
jgi:uncharacterized protein (DUF1499 family)